MIFLTYNDSFSGIYKSQVIDVCQFFEKELNTPTKLVALISLRNFFKQRKLIKSACSNSLVLPMFPKTQFWKLNSLTVFLICLVTGQRKIWARGPFACNMAITLKKAGLVKKVFFDARGAYLAELTEYNVVNNETVKKNIATIELKALTESDAHLAVSEHLKQWWKSEHSFTPEKSEIIPCTLSESFLLPFPSEEERNTIREKLGFTKTDIVLTYSGSSAGWQSFNLVEDFLQNIFSKNPNTKLIFMSDAIPQHSAFFKNYTDRIITKWVKPSEVRNILLAADYGLLIREKSITNKVASPVKFAEYLSCGLNIIISEEIGDFTQFVTNNQCGAIYTNLSAIKPVSQETKEKNHKLAMHYFSKQSAAIKESYMRLLGN